MSLYSVQRLVLLCVNVQRVLLLCFTVQCTEASSVMCHSTVGRGSVYELDRQTKCHRTGSVTELDEI